MNVKYLSLVCASVLLGLPLAGMSRTAGESTATTNATTVSEQVKTLAAMSGPERRAAMKKMSPEERRGVWFEAKRYQAAQSKAAKSGRFGQGNQNYSQIQGTKVTAKPSNWNSAVATIGTIQYDSGFPTIGFGGGAIIGNRFNTHTGNPVLTSGTVSTVQALVVPGPANTTSSAGFVLEGPQTTMGGAMALFSTFTGASGVIDSLSFTGLNVTYTGNSFFVLFGDFANSYIPVYGTESNNGQGHHGVVGYTGGMGPNITSTFDFGGALNSFIRAKGNILPVELMQFSVD